MKTEFSYRRHPLQTKKYYIRHFRDGKLVRHYETNSLLRAWLYCKWQTIKSLFN